MSTFRNLLSKTSSVPGFVGGWKSYGRSNSEDASTRDILPDYSGNGRDIKLYNFAFAGMSGWGGYAENFNDYSSPSAALISDHKLIHTVVSGNAWIWTRSLSAYPTTRSMQVKITGLSNSGISIYYYYIPSEKPDTRDLIDITSDGTYTLPASALYTGDGTNNIGFWQSALSDPNIGTTITIEQLPTYPGGLVSDGVDDYGQCIKGFSLPDDYTVVALRKIITGNNAAIASKGATMGAFLFDAASGSNNVAAWSYGYQNSLNNLPVLFSYQTKTSYNGTAISFGIQADTESDLIKLFTHNNSSCAQAVLYDLRIYDHSLTEDELLLVKDDMMRNYEKNAKPLEGITYVADWDAKGRSNDEDADVRDKWIDKATGKVINLNNFAYAGMSGWNGYGTDFKTWLLDNSDGAVTVATENTITIKDSIHPQGTRNNSTGAWKALLRVNKDCNLYCIEQYKNGDPGTTGLIPFKAGIWQEVSFEDKTDILSLRWVYFTGYSGNSLIITQAPYYPGALVGDGIDDYGVTQEAINEEVGTMLVYAGFTDELSAKGDYILDSPGTGDGRLYIWMTNTGKYGIGLPNQSAGIPPFVLTREPAVPAQPLYIAANNSGLYSACFIRRLILIREQLNETQIAYLVNKVQKEYNDWCRANGYEYAINQLTA